MVIGAVIHIAQRFHVACIVLQGERFEERGEGLLIAVGGLVRGVFPNAGLIDVTTYLIVVPTLVAITLLAAWVPARRAARIDPLVALRQE